MVKSYADMNTVQGAYRIAVVSNDDVTFGMFRMFMVYAERDETELHISRSKPEAMEWLSDSDAQNSIARCV